MSIEEHEIFKAQVRADREQIGCKDGMREVQRRGIFNLDERIYVYLLAAAVIGLFMTWATAKSALVLYGSFVLVIILTILWGIARVRGIERKRREREFEARAFEAGQKPPGHEE